MIVDHHIVQLPSNHIPKGLVPLERLFDNNDVAVKGNISKDDADVAECNIGTERGSQVCQVIKQPVKGEEGRIH
jgi:hypothetical protein